MCSVHFRFIVLIAAGLAFTCPALIAAPAGERYIIKFGDGREDAGRGAVAGAGTIVRDLARHNAVAARIPAAALEGLRRNPNVDYVEPDPVRYLLSHPTSGEVQPYGIAMVQADLVSDASAGTQTVCVIDTGYDRDHEDLVGNNVNVSGTSDVSAGAWYEDGNGHGTHVGGTISAIGNNSIGVVGVLPGGTVKLHIVRVYGDDGEWAYSSDLVAALDVCRDKGANVINMSLGGEQRINLENRAFDEAANAGVLSFAAAGNDGIRRKNYPASYDSVVSVAAVDVAGQVADFSQRNAQVELAAPGVAVLSTTPLDVGVHSDVTVNSVDYDSDAMEGSPRASATAPLVDCGLADSACAASVGAVCLIQRGEITFADKVINCEAGGGVAAIIYNNVAGPLSGSLGGAATIIPSVGISDTDGTSLLGQIGVNATINVIASNYGRSDGTSMATPHASGVAALVWSRHPSCSNDEIRSVLAVTALDLGAPGRDDETGHGLVQAHDAVKWLDANGCDGGTGGSCELLPRGAACSSDAECCANKCKGKTGAKICK